MNETIQRLSTGLRNLTDSQLAALGWPWWTYFDECDAIDDATRAAFMEHWVAGVDAAFERNRGTHRPAKCAQLIRALRLNREHYYRAYRSGDGSIPDTRLRYNHATILGVEEADLSPPKREYVAKAATWLVQLSDEEAWVGEEHALAYATYVLERVDHRGRPMGRDTITQLVAALHTVCPDDPVQGILDTAGAVGSVLTAEYQNWVPEIRRWEAADR